MPWLWPQTRRCLEISGAAGVAWRHFPAGTYEAQARRWQGETEMELMELLYRCWRQYSYLTDDQWGQDELALEKWLHGV